jgi:hypothetical protein
MNQVVGLAIDPQIQKIFDDMTAYMGTTYTGMTTTVNFDGQGTRETVVCNYPNSINNWQYVQYNQGIRVSITPITASLGPGQLQQFTATATNPDGTTVPSPSFVWTVVTGGLGTISPTGLYTAPATISAGSTDTIRCALSGSNSWATVSVTLHT